jgi:hypothetical protein
MGRARRHQWGTERETQALLAQQKTIGKIASHRKSVLIGG